MNLFLDSNHAKVHELLQQFQLKHLYPLSILNSDIEGSVYVDRRDTPEIVVVQGVGGDGELYIAGTMTQKNANEVQALLTEIIAANKDKDPEYHNITVYLSPCINQALFESNVRLDMIRVPRGYLRHEFMDTPQPEALDEGFRYQIISDDFIHINRYINIDDVIDMIDYPRKCNQEVFKRIGYGVAIIHEKTNELVSWCGFDYVAGSSIEFGIETAENWQRKGYAAKVVRKALEHVHRQGFKQVGWHYWWNNPASQNTALKAGFRLIGEEHVYHREMNDFDNFSLQAWWNYSFIKDYGRSKELYLKTVRLIENNAPDFLHSVQYRLSGLRIRDFYLKLAVLCSMRHELEEGIAYLEKSISHGFDDHGFLHMSDELANLRKSKLWKW